MSTFLDLLKKLTSSNPTIPGNSVPHNPRGYSSQRRVNQDVNADISTGITGDTRPRYSSGDPAEMTKLRDESQWLANDPTHGIGGSTIKKPSRLKAALLGMLQGAGR